MSNANELPSSNEPATPQVEAPAEGTSPANSDTNNPSLLGQQPTPPAPAFEPITPESFKLPEGLEIEQPIVQEFVELLNKQDLSTKDRAQALIDLQAKVATTAVERMQAAWESEQAELQTAVRNDPEIGGAKLEPTLASIAQVLNQYPNAKEIRALMDSTGMGNQPEAIKFMKWVADQLTEGKPAVGAPASKPERSIEQIFYPEMHKGA